MLGREVLSTESKMRRTPGTTVEQVQEFYAGWSEGNADDFLFTHVGSAAHSSEGSRLTSAQEAGVIRNLCGSNPSCRGAMTAARSFGRGAGFSGHAPALAREIQDIERQAAAKRSAVEHLKPQLDRARLTPPRASAAKIQYARTKADSIRHMIEKMKAAELLDSGPEQWGARHSRSDVQAPHMLEHKGL